MDTAGARELAKRIAEEEERRAHAGDGDPTSHLLFVSLASGYRLVPADGPVPKPGSEVTVSDATDEVYRVSKVGPSPLPGDPRPCAYLERIR